MSLIDNKITDNDIATKGVVSAPDRLTGTAQENKAVFDKLVSEPVRTKFNATLEALVAPTGASEIGFSHEGLEATNVEEALLELGGNTVDAVLFTAQSLTESQKAQARANIGAGGGSSTVTSVNGMTGAVMLGKGDVGFKDLTGTLVAGRSTIAFSDSSITTDSTIDVYTSVFGVSPIGITVTSGTCTVTFKVQANNVDVKVRVS